MARIQDIDPNFLSQTDFDPEEFDFYNAEEAPFAIEGVIKEGRCFCRMPSATADRISEGVSRLNWHTAGGRVRFRSNSTRMVLMTKQSRAAHFSHMPVTGSAGFDLYSTWDGQEHYERTFVPPVSVGKGYTSHVVLYASYLSEECRGAMRDMTLNLPLYCGVEEIWIGLERGCVPEAPTPYRRKEQIVYYGSSITQGGCASRPGNSYEAMISRRLGCPYLNLGFSGSAKGETAMAEYLCGLPASVLVMDYDHNAPDVAYLERTHEPFFRILRDAKPELPIVLMSMPKYRLKPGECRRREVILRTYHNAMAEGDRNVYFLDGSALMEGCGTDWSVDLNHPNDLGFFYMARGLGDLLERILDGNAE